MKTMKRYLLAALITATGSAQANSILDIYNLALENDPLLKADQAAYRAGLENKTIGRAGLLPQINASASYTISESTSGATVSEGVIVDDGSTTSDTDVVSWSVSLDQALIDLNAWHIYQQGIALSDQAKAQYSADQQSLIVRVAEAYFNVLRAVDNLEATMAEEKALEQQLQQTKQRFEVGLTPITDVHDAQAAFDTAQAASLEARGQLGIQYESLEVLTGQAHDAIAPLSDEFPVVPPSPANRHDWVEFALENNFTLKATSAAANAAEEQAKAARANHLPTLSASASYTETDTDTDIYNNPYNRSDSEGHSFGISLQVPLFSGLRTSGSRRQAYAQAMQADENFNYQQRNVIQATRSLHLAVETGVARVKARKQAIVSNESAVKATQSGFEVGTRNLVEVLLAQRSLFQARRDYSNALYDYIIQLISLREAAGMLTPADIERIDSFLLDAQTVRRSDYDV
ncbi:TolC family outer membrane protein [Gilvimarinus agarilyticus]|uniref:TolC family outer membrane protein n=1 Tax=unclassified Gilvimarinus TaxID=2642066 RepID=UPI001C09D89F|nr:MULTISPECIES: TolC family outer membrane protein [unclassified Gilvimarinus]MBU2887658.1 TolC family outer membrane protein [Gilvimarinus agarilyticus]MDO6572307.1 TolC family outer membrane protein [Gilvimarinus sp. 2_MG-2023]MDO6746479.1 TolC family outer membrane protein [Gilvimarinus sp. 1_MG-2023]